MSEKTYPNRDNNTVLQRMQLASGTKSVALAGSAEALAAAGVTAVQVDIVADSANSGMIYIGDGSVSAANGVALAPGDAYSIHAPANMLIDLSGVYLDADSDGDGVRFIRFSLIAGA